MAMTKDARNAEERKEEEKRVMSTIIGTMMEMMIVLPVPGDDDPDEDEGDDDDDRKRRGGLVHQQGRGAPRFRLRLQRGTGLYSRLRRRASRSLCCFDALAFTEPLLR